MEAIKQMHINKDLAESGGHCSLLLKLRKYPLKDLVYRTYLQSIGQMYGQEDIVDNYQKPSSFFLG